MRDFKQAVTLGVSRQVSSLKVVILLCRVFYMVLRPGSRWESVVALCVVEYE